MELEEYAKKYIPIALAGFTLFFVFLIGGIFSDDGEQGRLGVMLRDQEKESPFAALSLEAKAVIVWDIQKGIPLYVYNEEAQLPLASLSKMMTVVLAQEDLPEGSLVEIGEDAIRREGDSGFRVGERFLPQNLIDLTLISSSNDGAYALASAVLAAHVQHDNTISTLSFAGRMNKKAREIGLGQTFFINETGLDTVNNTSGGYGSAKDVASLLTYIVKKHPHLLEATQLSSYDTPSVEGKNHSASNTNKSITFLPAVLGSKTGFTDLAGGNLAIVFEAGPLYPIVVVVLGSTAEDRFTDVEKLVWATLESLSDSSDIR
ncbi:MAG TPA: hypothetical protein VJB70_04030 [Candidatus Paceibacterota bacterium]